MLKGFITIVSIVLFVGCTTHPTMEDQVLTQGMQGDYKLVVAYTDCKNPNSFLTLEKCMEKKGFKL